MSARQNFDLTAARRIMASTAFKSSCHDFLERALSRNSDLDLMSICTIDGRPFAFAQRMDAQPARVAALSATLMSVSESLAKEVNGERVDYATLTLKNGVVVSKRISDVTGVFTLSIVGRGSINLAMTLRATLDVAAELAEVINAQAQLQEQPA